jgi:hypothetical protein
MVFHTDNNGIWHYEKYQKYIMVGLEIPNLVGGFNRSEKY